MSLHFCFQLENIKIFPLHQSVLIFDKNNQKKKIGTTILMI